MDASSKKVPIKTVARVRPCSDGTNLQSSLIIDSKNSIITVKSRNKEFPLDNVFDENATQEKIYDTIAQPIVDEVLGGKNGTIFAYGQTGSGKTYTMNGNKVNGKNRGIIVRSVESIFEYLNARLKKDLQFKFSIKCSYIEVYKKRAFDLLQTDGAAVEIQSSGEKIIIEGAAEFVVTSVDGCLRHFQNGWNNRKTASTSMNRESSRSHAIFMLTLVTEEINGTFVNLRTSRLNFVDLAGSENQKHTKNTGERLKEAGCINQDLFFLLNIIRDLGYAKNGAFIPYRNCSLTHLLRDSLGGNSIAAVIVTIHSNLEFVNDTISTLMFAENCKKVKNEVKVNEAVSTKDVEAWKAEIQRVQKDKSSLMEENQKLLKENQQLKEQMEKRQKEDANIILILQNEKKMLEAESVKNAQEVNEEKQKLQTQISLLENNVAEQKQQITASEKRQKKASELESSLMEKIQQLYDEKEQMEKRQKEYEALLEKTVAEQNEQINALEKSQKEASESQLAQMINEYDLKIKKVMDDLKKSNERCEEMKHEKDNALQKIEDELCKYKLLVALLEKTVAEQKEQKANEKVVVVEAEVQTDQTENGSDDKTIHELPEENPKLLDSTRSCNLADVIVNGEIDYELLNGKVLLVKRLDFVTKWSVWNPGQGWIDISFEHSGFQIAPHELTLTNHQNLSSVLNRIINSDLKYLELSRMTIPFSDYKKLTGNKISSLRLNDVIVNDENGIKVGIDKLWKEVKNVKDLTHEFNDREAMSEIAQKLVELAPFPNLKYLYLMNVQDGFDLQAFYQFLIKNTTVYCALSCSTKSFKQMKEIQKELPKLPTRRGSYFTGIFHIAEY
uniref:Kinesin-like protein n=1 Tax=Panagrolaimus davidi TaxID=227884 RepID=A0A914QLV9_9BILA